MYYSPFRISGLTPEAISNEAESGAAFTTAKRRLQAELMLAGTQTLDIEGTALSLQDISGVFDELRDPQRRHFHTAIFNDQRLLDFLETGRLHAAKYWRRNELYHDPGFLAFISPFYTLAVHKLYSDVLKGIQAPAALIALSNNPLLLLTTDYDAAYQPAINYFIGKGEALSLLLSEVQTSDMLAEQAIERTITVADICILNTLPALYEGLRVDLAVLLKNISAQCNRKAQLRQALLAIEQAAAIRLADTVLAGLIVADLKAMQRVSNHGLYYVQGGPPPPKRAAQPDKRIYPEVVQYKGTLLKPISRKRANRIMLLFVLLVIILTFVFSLVARHRQAG